MAASKKDDDGPDCTTPAGEAFVETFAKMTRSMLAQSKALARTVSLAQVLDIDGNTSCDLNSTSDDKENVAMSSLTTTHRSGSAYRQKVLSDLRSVDTVTADLERRMAVLRAAIDSERQGIADMKKMREEARRCAAELVVVCQNLPQHLPHAAPPLSALSIPPSSNATAATINCSESFTSNACGRSFSSSIITVSAHDPDRGASGAGSSKNTQNSHEGGRACRVEPSASSAVPTVELVTTSELMSVARSTRGRLTITVINDAVMEIQKAVKKRHVFLNKPRAKLSEKLCRRLEELKRQEVPEHGGEPFLAESDIRALPTFKKGEVTTKALIATLRSLKRLKGVRAAGVMTYVVQGDYH